MIIARNYHYVVNMNELGAIHSKRRSLYLRLDGDDECSRPLSALGSLFIPTAGRPSFWSFPPKR